MSTAMATLMGRNRLTYAAVAARSGLQARTVRQIATGETPLDAVSVGTLRRIAAALEVPVAALIESPGLQPGDPASSRQERLAQAIRTVMWGVSGPMPYPSPVEGPTDAIAAATPEDFFAGAEPIRADRG